jgi:hypothetical protein
MPNNFYELCSLLETALPEHRNALGELIEAPFGNSPSLLCDHLCFLRAGGIGQFFDKRDYKQLVTDVADRVGIDWNMLVSTAPWAALSAEQIEAAIVSHVDPNQMLADDVQPHIPEPFAAALKSLLLRLVHQVPMLSPCDPLFEKVFDLALSFLSTDWRKLLAAVIYVNRVIRPKTQTSPIVAPRV